MESLSTSPRRSRNCTGCLLSSVFRTKSLSWHLLLKLLVNPPTFVNYCRITSRHAFCAHHQNTCCAKAQRKLSWPHAVSDILLLLSGTIYLTLSVPVQILTALNEILKLTCSFPHLPPSVFNPCLRIVLTTIHMALKSYILLTYLLVHSTSYYFTPPRLY